MPKPELTDLTLKLHHVTDKAILVSTDGEDKHAKWLPKSQIEYEEKGRGIVEVTLPIWLATDKGLV